MLSVILGVLENNIIKKHHKGKAVVLQ